MAGMNSTNTRKTVISVAICLAWTVIAPLAAGGAPVPPELIVNHEAEQCASFFPGDECVHAQMPEGWVSLGFEWDVECPAGYTFVELDLGYRGSQSEHCCSEWGSGSPGSCDNMVISRRARECAFVEDSEECFLPRGWSKHPADGRPWECPEGYSWIDDLACMTEEAAERAGRWVSWLAVAVGLVAAGVLVLCSVVLWFLLRRRR
jgi:hypothetical protein